MAQSDPETPKETRRRWSPEEKAALLQRYLKGGESAADLSDETGVSPSLLALWTKTLFEEAPRLFQRDRGEDPGREIAARDARIGELQEVVTELSTEVIRLKKKSGDPFPGLGSPPRSRRTS